jgi:hypothetical protein
MKRITLFLISISLIGCNLDVNQVVSTDDGYSYTISTYSTGWSSIPKGAFDMETSGLNSKQVDSVKKEHLQQWEIFKQVQ